MFKRSVQRVALFMALGSLFAAEVAVSQPPSVSASTVSWAASTQPAGRAPTGTVPPPIETDGTAVGEPLTGGDVSPSLSAPPVAEPRRSMAGDPTTGKQAPLPVTPGTSSFDPARSVEDPTMRSQFVTVFENPDGTQSARIGSEAQNFKLPNGTWEVIDPRLVPVAGQRGVFRTAKSSVVVTVSLAGLELRGENGEVITMVPGAGAVTLPTPTVSSDGLVATFAQVWPGVDVRFRVSNSSVSKEIVITKATGQSTFEIAVSGVNLTQRADSTLSVVGKSDFQVGQVEVFDKSGTPISEVARPSQDLRTTAESAQRGGTGPRVVALGVDPGWLAGLPADAFPVVLDPSWSYWPVQTNGNMAWATNGYTCPTNNNCDHQRVGNSLAGGDSVWRSISTWDYSSIQPTATVASSLISATFTAAYTSGTTSSQPIALRRATTYNWCGFNVNGDCGQPYSPLIGGITQPLTTGSVAFNVTAELGNYWYAGAPNIGWALSSSENPGQYSYKQLGSYLTITYDRLPIISQTGVTPAANPYLFHQHLSGVSLGVPAQSDPDGETIYYHFILCTQTTWNGCASTPGSVWMDSGWIPSNTFNNWNGAGMPASWYNQQLYWGVQVSNLTSSPFQLASGWMRPWMLYNNAAPAPQLVSPVDGFKWAPQSPPTLSFTTPSDSDGDDVRYRAVISDAGAQGALWTSPWTGFFASGSSGTSVQVPADLPLTPDSMYTWTVEFQDRTTQFHWYYWLGQPQGAQPASRATGFDDRLGATGPSPMQSTGPVSVNMATGNVVTSVGLPSVSTLGGSMGGSLSYNSRPNDVGLRSWIVNDTNDSGMQDSGEQAAGSIDPSLRFRWASPAALPGVSKLLATWSGYVTAPTTGQYYFAASLGADEKAKVTVNNTSALDVNWAAGSGAILLDEPLNEITSGAGVGGLNQSKNYYLRPNVNAGSAGVLLQAGVATPITVSYRNPGGDGVFALYVSNDSTTFQTIPSSWLSPSDRVLPRGWVFNHSEGLGASYVAVRQDADQVFLIRPDGSRVAYQRTADGKGFTPEAGEGDVVAIATDGTFVVTDAAGYVHTFDPKGELLSVTAPIDARSSAAPVSTWTSWTPPGTTVASSRLTAQTDPTTGYQVLYTYQGVAGGVCPAGGAYAAPPAGTLCKVTYPDGSETSLYFVDLGLGEVGLTRVENPGDATIGKGSFDLGYKQVNTGTYTVPMLNRIRGDLANDAMAAGLITSSEDYQTLITFDSAGRADTVRLPKAAVADTSRQQITFEYVANTNETRTHIDGLDNAGSSTDWDRKATFDSTARVLLDYKALNASSWVWSQTDTRWDPIADRVDVSIVDKQVTTTIYNTQGQPVDQYGPANESCFNLTVGSGNYKLPNGTCTTPGVPRTTTEYDTVLNANGSSSPMTGLGVTVWPNTTWSGQPSNVATGLGPNYTTFDNNWGAWGPPEATTTAGVSLVDNFSLRAQGEIVFPAAGTWTITTASDDTAYVYIDDKLVTTSMWSVNGSGTYTAVAGDLTKRIRVDVQEGGGGAQLTVMWAGPGVAQQAIPTSALRPRYGLPTRTTTIDSGGGTPDTVTQTEYSAAGIDPAVGLATRTTVDPTGMRLTTTTGYETSGYRRRVSRALPAGTTTTYEYYATNAGAAQDVACTAANDTTVKQGSRPRLTVKAASANGKSIISEVVYDILGRSVAAREGTRLVGVDTWGGWACNSFDARWRPTTTLIPAVGAQPARTVTYNYALSGNPLVTTIADPTVLRTVTDLLGRVVESDDYWQLATTAVFDQTTGRLTSSTSPAPAGSSGVQTFTYDRGGRLTSQTLDGVTVAVPTYNNAGDANPHVMGSTAYPSGAGNGGNNTTGTITRSTQTGAVTALSWKQGATVITSDTVTRSITGRVATETVDGSLAWTYRYDSVGRLTRATGSGHDYQYGYGNTACSGPGNLAAAGLSSNRTLVRDNGVTTQSGCFDTADRMTSYGTPTAAYSTRVNQPGAPGSFWKLADTSGTTAVATTGTAGTYSATGVTKNVTGAPTGETNKAVTLSGGNVQIPIAAVTGSGKTFTLWFKTSSSGVLLSKNQNASGGATGAHNPLLYVGTDGRLRAQVYGGPIAPITTSAVVNDNQWHHVIVAVAATSQTFWVDGVKVGTKTGTSVDDSWAPAYAYIGTGATNNCCWPATTGTWMPFTGSVDEVAIYNTVFTDADVAVQDNPAPSTGVVTPTFDDRGNMLTLNGDVYTYDSSNRHTVTSHGATTVTYVRDAANNIVSRADSATGVTVRYSGNAVLNTSGVVIERTISLPGGVMVTKRAGGDVWSYPNIHGDVVAVANATGVKQGSTGKFDPYGNNLSTLPDNSTGNWDFGWVGQHTKGTEHATGLVTNIEMGARIYNPNTGRFLSADPVEGGCSTDYTYGYGDPVNFHDLNGMDLCGALWQKIKELAYAIREVSGQDTLGLSQRAKALRANVKRIDQQSHINEYDNQARGLSKRLKQFENEHCKPPGGFGGLALLAGAKFFAGRAGNSWTPQGQVYKLSWKWNLQPPTVTPAMSWGLAAGMFAGIVAFGSRGANPYHNL